MARLKQMKTARCSVAASSGNWHAAVTPFRLILKKRHNAGSAASRAALAPARARRLREKKKS